MRGNMPTVFPASRYEIRSKFRAPLPFVFEWCTDYSSDDPRLEKENYTRKILGRKGRRVTYEDLYDTPNGWMWSHQTVTLHPPNRWHAEALGNYREWSLEYTLKELPDGRTELTLRGQRRPTPLGGRNPPRPGWSESCEPRGGTSAAPWSGTIERPQAPAFGPDASSNHYSVVAAAAVSHSQRRLRALGHNP